MFLKIKREIQSSVAERLVEKLPKSKGNEWRTIRFFVNERLNDPSIFRTIFECFSCQFTHKIKRKMSGNIFESDKFVCTAWSS